MKHQHDRSTEDFGGGPAIIAILFLAIILGALLPVAYNPTLWILRILFFTF